MLLVVLGASCPVETRPQALFTNDAITYFIVLLGAIGMTGEWRHRTITGSRARRAQPRALLAAKALAYAVAGVVLSLLVTVATMVVGTVILEHRGEATLGAGGLADVLWRNLAVAAVLGPLGVCIGALIRNQVVTVVGLIVLAAVLEPAVLQRRPGVGRFGPLSGAPGGVLGVDESGCWRLASRWPCSSPGSGRRSAAATRLRRRDLV